MLTIGIVGNGFVGKATRLFECEAVKVLVYDLVPELCVPRGTVLEDLGGCDLVFVAVPTPMGSEGECHTGIVKSVLEDLAKVIDRSKTHLVLRSTVPPGFSDTFGIHFMPEFLTEKAWKDDFFNQGHWYFGTAKGASEASRLAFEMKARHLIEEACKAGKIAHSNVHFVANGEAEMMKYARNTFLATKIGFFNELAALCEAKEIDFEMVRRMTVADPRIGGSHSAVPGHDDKRGFGGTCLPKDISALCQVFKGSGLESYILEAVKRRNDEVDRVGRDWQEKGRSVV